MITTNTSSAPQDSSPRPTLHLHTYFRSSCSARLRIALALKHLAHTSSYVHLLRDEQTAPTYTALNPSGTVPTLTHTLPSGTAVTVTQSVAALEYLDEAFPRAGPALLPPDAVARAAVRTLVNIVACDIQPLTNSKPMKAINAMGQDGAAWNRTWTTRGLDAFEKVLERVQTDERFCVGEAVTLADVCLVPAVWGAERWGCDLERWPRVAGVVGWMAGLEEVRGAHWKAQDDTPEEFREG